LIYTVRQNQVSYGEAIGILAMENYVPFVPGDVANATTYDYPVRFRRVPGLTTERIFARDTGLLDTVREACLDLQAEGVRAITGDCGFMLLFQEELAGTLRVPLFLSSLLQLPFMEQLLGKGEKIGVVTANARSLDTAFIAKSGIRSPERVVVEGLEEAPHFVQAVFREEGELDTERLKGEVTEAVRRLMRREPDTALILLECSLLPPYGAAVREVTGLPVFDYVTMIDYVYSAVVKRRFTGFM
jgi:hypothetical protein